MSRELNYYEGEDLKDITRYLKYKFHTIDRETYRASTDIELKNTILLVEEYEGLVTDFKNKLIKKQTQLEDEDEEEDDELEEDYI